jgi:hypothetical protein
MSARFQRLCLSALVLLLAVSSLAQPLPKALAPVNNSDTSTATTDPLGRETPAGTVFGFLQACQSANYKTAAQYLDLPARKQSEGPEIAMQLKALIDTSGANVSLKRISTRPEGDMQEGVAFDRQHLGTLVAGDSEAPLLLERQTKPSIGKLWYFSSDTLEKVPELYDQIQAHEIEKKLRPRWWKTNSSVLPCGSGLRCFSRCRCLLRSRGCSSKSFRSLELSTLDTKDFRFGSFGRTRRGRSGCYWPPWWTASWWRISEFRSCNDITSRS